MRSGHVGFHRPIVTVSLSSEQVAVPGTEHGGVNYKWERLRRAVRSEPPLLRLENASCATRRERRRFQPTSQRRVIMPLRSLSPRILFALKLGLAAWRLPTPPRPLSVHSLVVLVQRELIILLPSLTSCVGEKKNGGGTIVH